MRPTRFPLKIGISLDWEAWELWARTPRFQTVFEEMAGDVLRGGLGVAWEPEASLIHLSLEYSHEKLTEEKRNYYQHYHWKRENSTGLFRMGGEFRATQSLAIRLGLVHGQESAEYHLSLEPVDVRRFTLGLAYRRQAIQMELAARYDTIEQSANSLERNTLIIIFQINQALNMR